MGKTDRQPSAVRRVPARRISTADPAAGPVDETVGVVREAALTLDVKDVGSYTLLCTPGDERALAAGFLLSEGIIRDIQEIAVLKPCDDDEAVWRVKLTGKVPWVEDKDRSLLIVSSCGACGSEDIESRLRDLPPVGDALEIDGAVLRSLGGALRERQVLFDWCGGTHAAGIFDGTGKILASAEDAGRHNALDKAIGKCLLAGTPTAGLGVVLSGRTSFEMVGKCAKAGIELISAVSAPTTLAIEVAERCNITLCAFVRETRATVFCHPRRVIHPAG
jgi:FdhD protein